MAVQIDLTEKEAQFVSDLIDWWLEGYAEAKAMTTQDKSIEDVDTLLDLMSGLDDGVQMCHILKGKLDVRSAA